jgi:hypothetical protein
MIATDAEAELTLGNLDRAVELYSRAIRLMRSPRDIDSMYSQAIRAATHIHVLGASRVLLEFPQRSRVLIHVIFQGKLSAAKGGTRMSR